VKILLASERSAFTYLKCSFHLPNVKINPNQNLKPYLKKEKKSSANKERPGL
jgi:hypothetical protein